VLAAWIAYQVQSLVSIDVPGLIYTQWVFGGILLAKGVDGGVREVRIPGLRARGSSPLASGESVLGPVQRFLLAGSIGLVFLAVAIWVSAPLRADLHAGSAQKAFVQNDFQKAGDELQRAIELQPNNGFLADAMARVYWESGLDELALEEFERSARLQPGYPGAARIAAGTALELGQYGLASEWYERLVLDDPNGTESLVQAAKFYASIGRSDRSEALLDRFYALDSTAPDVWKIVADVHEQLGRYWSAGRIRLCLGENGQYGIGVGCVYRP
jgi:tetratricopeptide (TPR) repeat protein